jgi:hypothetical protein
MRPPPLPLRGGTRVTVAVGMGVAVGDTRVAVNGTGVAVAGIGVALGGTGVGDSAAPAQPATRIRTTRRIAEKQWVILPSKSKSGLSPILQPAEHSIQSLQHLSRFFRLNNERR